MLFLKRFIYYLKEREQEGARAKGENVQADSLLSVKPEEEVLGFIPGRWDHHLSQAQEFNDQLTESLRFPCCLCYWFHTLEIITNVIKFFLFIFSSRVLFRVLAPFLANFYISCKVRIQIHSFARVNPIFPGLFVKKIDISPLNGPGTLYYFESLKSQICLKLP